MTIEQMRDRRDVILDTWYQYTRLGLPPVHPNVIKWLAREIRRYNVLIARADGQRRAAHERTTQSARLESEARRMDDMDNAPRRSPGETY